MSTGSCKLDKWKRMLESHIISKLHCIMCGKNKTKINPFAVERELATKSGIVALSFKRKLFIQSFFFSAHLKASRSLSLLAWQRAGRPQEAKHLVHHVGVVDGLQTGLLHLLHHLLLPANLLLLLLLSLSVFFRQLGQTLLEIKMYLYSLDG